MHTNKHSPHQSVARQFYNVIRVASLYFLLIAVGLSLFLVGRTFVSLEDFFMPIGIEIMGGAVTFFLIVYFWDHPQEKEHSNRMEEVLNKLELHRDTKAKHILESANQMEIIEKLSGEKPKLQRNVPNKFWWFLIGALFGIFGTFLFVTKKR